MKKSIRSFLLLGVLIGSIIVGTVTAVQAFYFSAEINESFDPLAIVAGQISRLSINIYNPNSVKLDNASFTDSLSGVQPGLKIAAPVNLTNSCGGIVIAAAGATTISLSGGTVPPQVGSTRGSCTVSIDVTSTTPGNLINTIPAYGVPPAYGGVGLHATGRGGLDEITNTTPASATLQVTAVQPPSMSKSFTPNTVWINQPSQLQIRIINNDNNNDLNKAAFTDTLPASFVIAAPLTTSLVGCGTGTLTAAVGANSITLNNAKIAKSATCIINVNVVSATQGQYTNTIPAGPGGAGSLQTQEGVTNSSPVTANINVQAVGINKSFNPKTIQKGDTSLLTITLNNPTGADISGEGLVDTLPAGLTIFGTPASPQCGGVITATSNSITLTNGLIPAGNITTPGACKITAQVTGSIPATYTNTIPANAMTGPITNLLPAADSLTVQARTIGVVKAFGGSFVEGGNTSLTITLQNMASTTLTGVTFTDNLPANLTILGTPTASISCGGGATVTSTANSITLTNGLIPPGTVALPGTCVITATVTSTVPGNYSNTIPAGHVSSDQSVGNTASNVPSITVYPIGSPATVSKAFLTSPILAGASTRLRITITAPHDTALSGMNISDTLPDDMVIVGTPSPTTTCGGALTAAVATNLIQLSGGTIPAMGGSCTITVYVTSFTAGSHTNTIPGNTLSTYEGRTDPNPHSATLTVTNLSTSKLFTPDTISPSGLSTLTISLQNTNLLPLLNVSLTDLLSSMGGDASNGVFVAPTSHATTTCGTGTVTAVASSQTISMANGVIPASDGVVPGLCTISVDVQGKGIAIQRTNTLQASKVFGTLQGTSITMSPVADATASLTITSLDIKVVKGFLPVLVTDGSASVLSIQLTNTFPVPFSRIKFSDTMPTNMILADPVNFDVGSCGGSLSGASGDGSFSYSGGSLPAEGICTLTLNVTMKVIGNLINNIAAGDVTTFEGATNLQGTSATLTNLSGASVSKVFAPNPIPAGSYSLLTITIKNSDKLIGLTGMGLEDDLPGALPSGLEIAGSPAPDPVNNCGGTLLADPGTQTINLSGATLAANSSCTIVIPVTSNVPNDYLNTIPKNTIIESTGNVTNNEPTSDTLLVTAYSLGNRVWDDNGAGGGIANNGLRDGAEPGLNNVTVNLYQDSNKDGTPDGVSIATTTTDSDGYYRFDNLASGAYIVEIVPPAGYTSSTIRASDPNNGLDNDNNGIIVVGGNLRSNPVTVGPGSNEPTGETDPATNPLPGEAPDNQSNRTVDFGLFQTYSLGNRVWNDNGAGGGSANNGLRDGTEPGLSGVRVNLYRDSNNDGTPDGSSIAFTLSDANGYYRFDNLSAGYYIVEVVTPAGYVNSSVKAADPNNGIDDDNNGAVLLGNNIRSQPVALGLPTAANEPTGETDPATNPLPGEASDNQSNRTVDFGFSSTYSLGNRIWDDNGAGGGTADNGLRDGTEPGLSGVTVNLYQDSNSDGTPDGASIASTTTDGNGYYRFDGLLPDTYLVEAALPSGYTSSAVSDPTPNDAVDNDNNGVTLVGNDIRTAPLTIGSPAGSETITDNDPLTNPLAGEAPNNFSNRTIDFGFFHSPYSLGNRVWSDSGAGGGTANNGLRDGTEPGLAGVTVKLYRDSNQDGAPDGNAIASVLTDSNGYYRFDNLIADTYIVDAAIPGGYTSDTVSDPTPIDAVDDDNNGVTVVGGYIRTKPVTIGNPAGSEPTAETDPSTNPLPGEASDNYSNRTVDIGFAPLAALGDRVWNDLNHNGIQDAAEPGLTGVKVDLYTSGGTLVTTTTSAGGGLYLFNNLAPADYYLVFTPPTGFVITLKDQGGDDSKDSDADPTTGYTIPITLLAGQNDPTWDSGMYQPAASLGDFVWNDLNRNGIQDGDEPGISGVKVDLFRPGFGPDGIPNTPDDALAVNTSTTDSAGIYSFTNLIPGTYSETFTSPAGYAFTLKNQGTDNTLDSNPDPATGQTPAVALLAGQNDLTWDAGLYQLASLGDRVWNDANQNGIQDSGELGINGVTVRLYSESGTFLASTTTTTIAGLDGIYRFNNLIPGNYYVVFSPPGGYAFTLKGQGADSTVDSNADLTSGQTDTITLAAGDNDSTWDAGLYQLSSLGDFVWNDLNKDGIQEAGEPGIDGVTVNLYRPGYGPDGIAGTLDDSAVAATTTTAAGGLYSFGNLVPGDYYVEFTPPAGYAFGPKDQGSDDTLDSDADETTGQTVSTTLTPGQMDQTWDAGIYQLKASMGDRVWLDANGNGIQDAGETGINNATVDLYDGTGLKIASDTTKNVSGQDGIYSFTDLIPGYYYVVFTPPAAYDITLVDQGGDDSKDSDADPTTGRTVTTLLNPGQDDISWDAGLDQSASIGDFAWNDMNGNGIQDAGEVGVPNVQVDLYRVGSGQVATAKTDAAGAYLFNNLVPGDYYLIFTPPSGFVITPINQGGDNSLDSDANPTVGANYGKTATTTLLSGQADLTWDAGLYQPASLGDFVWVDKNADGIQNAGEPGLANVTVNLLASDGATVLATTTTDGAGKYNFSNLTPASYFVQFEAPSGYLLSPYQQGSDATKDSNADLTTGKTVQLTLVSGQSDTSWDAGLYQLAALGDFVWVDTNGNGLQDAGEPGLSGVTVNLLNSAGTSTLQTTTTDAAGKYSFANLTPGSYQVGFVSPSGYAITLFQQGGNAALDSNADRNTGKTALITLISAQNDTSWDAGLYQPASLGDFVWVDTNGNGLQDAGEPPLSGVTVNLLDSTGTSTLQTTTTDAAGKYSFSNLIPGGYRVGFVKPSGYAISLFQQGGNAGLDSNADRVSGKTALITLVSNQTDLTWDAGLYQPAALGDFVWIDKNANGIQDAGETGLNNVTVRLLNGAGTSTLQTTTTNASGIYSFNNLIPGSYMVQFVTPGVYHFSPYRQGSDTTLDSDADTVSGKTAQITLVSNQTDLNWDAGMYQLASLGNFVWVDKNADGIQNGGETGLNAVTVKLLDSSGTTVLSTTATNAAGNYSFANLIPGSYTVQFVAPSGYLISPYQQGGNAALDSNADLTTGKTVQITLVSGQNDTSWDAGLYQLASLGDFVWLDTNGNGIQNGGEPGLSGVTVNLLNSAGTSTLQTTTTDATGKYSFANLTPGSYHVGFVTPSGYAITLYQQGGNAALDSNADRTTGQTALITLISAQNDTSWDAGLYQPALLGDFVWVDTNGNGLQDAGEPPLSGVTVNLLDSAGTSTLQTTTTDAAGKYSFSNLIPGGYRVGFVKPSGYSISLYQQGSNTALDSNADQISGKTALITLVSNQTDLTWDAGLYQPAALGDFVWLDANGNGLQDIAEAGIPNVKVDLYQSGVGKIASTTTNASGLYSFNNLIPAGYYVQFTPPGGYAITLKDQGADNTIDSDADPSSGQTALTNLLSGQNDTSWDSGLYQPAAVGDIVWVDKNADGLQDAGEPGLSGVTVYLLDSLGSVSAAATTDSSGKYSFNNLVPGNYFVQFVPPTGYHYSPYQQGSNTALDSNAALSSGETAQITLVSAQTDNSWDAGMYQTAALGDFVWVDSNGNGLQDAGEPALNGVTVNLFDSTGTNLLATTTTAGSGQYSFTNLTPSSYQLGFVLPAGYQFSLYQQGSDAALDSDAAVGSSGKTVQITLISGQNDTTWDAGLYLPASLGDFVWVDTNGNGLQDAGEPGLSGVTVNLLDSAGTAILASTSTDSNGKYSFTGLIPGAYVVQFTQPAGYAITLKDQGSDDAADSDADRTTGKTAQITLLSNQSDLSRDAGLYQPASLGDFVWEDANGNGLQDAGEPALSNVTVNLLDSAGSTILASAATDSTGKYNFSNLIPGNYQVGFVPPAGYAITLKDRGADNTLDSDADQTNGKTDTISLVSNQTDLSWDAGLYQPITLGDFVWLDSNGNGIQDTAEPGLSGVTVNLLGSDGTTILSSATTDNAGKYSFSNLIPGNYAVQFIPPAGYTITLKDQGSDNTVDSDADRASGQTAMITLASNQTDLSWDAGLYQPASLGNFVWLDTNGNGIQDNGETGLANVKVDLYQAGAGLVATTSTDANGLYLFGNLIPADYSVQFTPPSSYSITRLDQGSDDTLDSDADRSTGHTATTSLLSGESDLSWDAGLYQPASLGDFVWTDKNANGIQDAGEPGLSGVAVNLLDSDGTTVISSTATGSSGEYSFTNLIPGNYYLQIVPPTGYHISPDQQGSDATVDSNADQTTGKTVQITLLSNQTDLSWDAGLYQQASLGDFVWTDKNADGIQDAGEPGLSGVTVNLLASDGSTVLSSTTTDSSGNYNFTNLVPNSYVLQFVPPANFHFSPYQQGSDPAVDSNADQTSAKTVQITLVSGQTDLSWDAGLYQLASLGDFVWVDANGNGLQDAGEPGLSGVTVNLLASDGTTVLSTTATDSSGKYSFTNLLPASYIVQFVLPTGYQFSLHQQGSDAELDSNADQSSGKTAQITLVSDQADPSWDAGLYQPTELGDFVWLDNNGNGVQDAGEPGLSGVTVKLLGSDGTTVLYTTTTDSSGKYSFTDLIPGNYFVQFTPPSGYDITLLNQGSDNKVDSDADRITGRTAQITLVSNQSDLSWDAGLYQPASLGDFVWEDINGNGIQDTAEPGIAGVTVNLLDGSGKNLITSATTNSTGKYGFNNLIPADYIVQFVQPAGYAITLKTQGTDDKVDSDADRTTGQTAKITLVSNQTDLSWDAGLYQPASIGDFVWLDTNMDGIQDAGETGIAGLKVELYQVGAGQVATTTTDANGLYLFDNLIPAKYYLQFDPPQGDVFSRKDQGTDDTLDSDADRLTGQTVRTTLVSAQSDLTWDAGLYTQQGKIGAAKRVVGQPARVSAGIWDVTYELLVKNYGNVPLTNIQVSDDLTATYPTGTTFTVQSLSSKDFTVNWPAYTGRAGNQDLLAGSDSLDVQKSGLITIVVRVTPATGGPFNNSAVVSGQPLIGDPVLDQSQNGTDPDPDKDLDPTNNNVPTPVDFGPNLFDPPFGVKVLDKSNLPDFHWVMNWINDTNIVAIDAAVSDGIPLGTSFVDSGILSGSPLPAGPQPVGTVSSGVICTPKSVQTSTTYCYYEGPTTAYPHGRIVWQGVLGPDFGIKDPAKAVNDLQIEFVTRPANGVKTVVNKATIDADLNGDGDTTDPGEQKVASASANWHAPDQLPLTGFAPGKITSIPASPQHIYQNDTGLAIEIPALGIKTTIVGVPQTGSSWDVTWLGSQLGYLEGTAFPTWAGNSVITGHVYDAEGKPGPFVNLGNLKWGDQVIIDAFGQRYVYEVRSTYTTTPQDTSVISHEDLPWLTLITCKQYDASSGTYQARTIVKAVLVNITMLTK